MSDNNGRGSNSVWIWILLIGTPAWFFLVQPQNHKNNIEKVLQADKSLNARTNSEAGLLELALDPSTVMGRYVAGLRAIDLSGCPEEFRTEFKAHI